MKKILFYILLIASTTSSLLAQTEGSTESHEYKTVDSVTLHLNIYRPSEKTSDELLPAVIFFFGGGWVSGTVDQFKPHCQFLASQGIIGITADYRVKNKHGTTPLDAIMDAKSAMRWLKKNGPELGIDPKRIVAAGGSAGGHLAAATATIDEFNDPSDDFTIDPTPVALILFNPVLNTNMLIDRFLNEESSYKASPINFIDEEVPPTLIFHGTDDQLVPYDSMLEFQRKMQEKGNYCEVILFGGMRHAFFNKGANDDRPFNRTLVLMIQFIDEFVLRVVK
jgi:acetyl esterase/lipase